jgi:hypothetical protein
MRRILEGVLHLAVLAPICTLVGGIAILGVACGLLSDVGDQLAGERPWSRSGIDKLRMA